MLEIKKIHVFHLLTLTPSSFHENILLNNLKMILSYINEKNKKTFTFNYNNSKLYKKSINKKIVEKNNIKNKNQKSLLVKE